MIIGMKGVLAGARRRSAAAGVSIVTANVTSADGPTSGTTITLSVDATGANAIFVFFLAGAFTTGFSGVSATYNGAAMTQVFLNDPLAGVLYHGCFRILSPASGAHNAVITVTGDTIGYSASGAIPMSGVNTGTPTGTPATGNDLTGTSTTATVTVSSAANEIVLGSVLVDTAPSTTNGGGQTTQFTLNTAVGANLLRVTSQTGAASVSPSWTFAANAWIAGGFGVKP